MGMGHRSGVAAQLQHPCTAETLAELSHVPVATPLRAYLLPAAVGIAACAATVVLVRRFLA